MTPRDTLLLNLDQVFEGDGDFQPSDDLLDEIWKGIHEASADRPMLMSDVINGDPQIDSYQIDFAASNSFDDALKLRERLQELFRDWAYKAVEDYESDARTALRERGETA